jgi:hypothetical protein
MALACSMRLSAAARSFFMRFIFSLVAAASAAAGSNPNHASGTPVAPHVAEYYRQQQQQQQQQQMYQAFIMSQQAQAQAQNHGHAAQGPASSGPRSL